MENRTATITESLTPKPSLYPDVRNNIIGWLQQVYGTHVPIALQIEKLREEWMELDVTWRDEPENDEEIINELTDIAIVAIGILGLYGADFAEEAAKKTTITRQKYDAKLIHELQLKGYSLEEALQICRDNWQNIRHYEPQRTTRTLKSGI
jgi:hypothetical protein